MRPLRRSIGCGGRFAAVRLANRRNRRPPKRMDQRRLQYLKAMDIDVWVRRSAVPAQGAVAHEIAPPSIVARAATAPPVIARAQTEALNSPSLDSPKLDWPELEIAVKSCT